jgi:serine O-acetyltransferase
MIVYGRPGEDQSASAEGVDPACQISVRRDILRLLKLHATPAQYRRFSEYAAAAAGYVAEDVTALAHGDPAAGRSWDYVRSSYASYQAVAAYRLAHAVRRRGARHDEVLARRISEDAKICTGIEIHPGAVIGRRFVLDHAFGTVIGETSVLGDDCYVLQGVIVGATGIAGNASGKRHPTIGDRVQIGAFARLLGPITVGSDTRIGPHAVVLTDIPEGCHVRLLNQCQVRSPRATIEIFGVVPLAGAWLEIHGSGLDCADARLLDADGRELDEVPMRTVERTPARLTCQVDPQAIIPADSVLRITEPGGERLLITQLGAVWRAMRGAGLRSARLPAAAADSCPT